MKTVEKIKVRFPRPHYTYMTVEVANIPGDSRVVRLEIGICGDKRACWLNLSEAGCLALALQQAIAMVEAGDVE